MKSRYLDKTRNKIELSGEIEESFTIRVGVTVSFAEGATFKDTIIKPGQTLYNNEYISKKFSISPSGTLSLIYADEIAVDIRNNLADIVLEENEHNPLEPELPFNPEHQLYSLMEILREGLPIAEEKSAETLEIGATHDSDSSSICCSCGLW